MPEFFQAIQNSLPELSAAGLFFLFFFGTFISEDAACLLAGTAAATGRVNFPFALTACFLGIFAGDVLLYGAGRFFGPRIFNNRLVMRFVSKNTLAKASAWLENNAAAAVFMSRFVTGLRLPTYLMAGALQTDITKFAAYFLLASAIWTPILVGSTAFTQSFLFPKNAILGLIVIAVAVRLILKFSTRKNRRLFVGRLKRIVNWEFWPIQIFYGPVVLYIFFLGIKHRGLTVFTAANPAIPAGGFKGESKKEIYDGLKHSNKAAQHLPAYTLLNKELSPSDRLILASRFIDQNGLQYPIVIKPDAGERGKGVSIIYSHDEMETVLLKTETDIIMQEFVTGDEISIFYYRYPNCGRGHIFSITEKHFPYAIGDGRSKVEDLILNDPRAVCLAGKYLEHNRERLDTVPADGEKIQIIDIGTHSRGAIFLDGDWLKTDALEQKIDEICGGYEGFYFGRFDIRTSSLNDLMSGENFKIIELNGVTSESTNIYDPKYSLTDAYRILFRQWRVAFEIGSANIRLGEKATGVLELLRLTLGLRNKPCHKLSRSLTTRQLTSGKCA